MSTDREEPLRLRNPEAARWSVGDEAVNVKGDLFYTAAEYSHLIERERALCAALARAYMHMKSCGAHPSYLAEQDAAIRAATGMSAEDYYTALSHPIAQRKEQGAPTAHNGESVK